MALRKPSCKNTPQYLRSCCSPIGQNNTKDFSAQSGGSMGRAVWKWSGKIRFPGVFSASLVNLRRFISLPDLFPPAPASRPWVSEDVEYLSVRSQNVQRNFQVRHQKNKRQGIVWLPVKLEGASQDLLQIVQLVTTKPPRDNTSARGA